MEQYLCPQCGANVKDLLHCCDCCGAVLDRKKSFLFFSVVAWNAAASMIMDILRPVEAVFAQRYGEISFSEALDQIGIIPLCFPEEMHQDPKISKERRYVTLKKRYADMRLHLSYEALICADRISQLHLCAANIAAAAAYVRKRTKPFRKKHF